MSDNLKEQTLNTFANHITICKMCDKDLLYLKENLITEFDNFWNYEILKQEFLNTNTTYIVAKQNETIVGFAGILTIVDEANIMNIVTKKDKRNLGIGTLLLQNLIQISKEQNPGRCRYAHRYGDHLYLRYRVACNSVKNVLCCSTFCRSYPLSCR